MTTIRERDAAWAEARKLGRQEFPTDWNVMEDRRALLSAGDVLAEAAEHATEWGDVGGLLTGDVAAVRAALAAWKAATG